MEQPVENINNKNMNSIPQNQQVRAYKEVMRTILEIAGDHYDGTYPCLEKVNEDFKTTGLKNPKTMC